MGKGRKLAGILAAAAMALGMLAAPATADNGLITVLTTTKLKPSKKVSIKATCTDTCNLTATLTLKLKGPDIAPATVSNDPSMPFTPGQIALPYIILNGPATHALKADPNKARLQVLLTATDVNTGLIDNVERTFKFKK